MIRYIALRWAERNPTASAQRGELRKRIKERAGVWEEVFCTAGLIVFVSRGEHGTDHIYPMSQRRGIVVGRLFERDGDPGEKSTFASICSDNEIRAPADLLKKYWGRYVAFFANHPANLEILRDPQGWLPCYWTTAGGVDVFFSDAQDCAELGIPIGTVNWEFVRRYVRDSSNRSSQTGLQDVRELRPGESAQWGADGKSVVRLNWDPLRIAAERLEDKAMAAQQLVATTVACVGAWQSCYPRILQLLSGGLDSSIVMSCIESADDRATALTYFDPDTRSSDERSFSRAVASAQGCTLIEKDEHELTGDLTSLLRVAKSPTPSCYLGGLRHNDFESHLVERIGATAIFSGVGGDQIFFQGPLGATVADYAWVHGLDSHFVQLLRNVSANLKVSIWSLLRVALTHGVFGNRRTPPTQNASPLLMADGALPDVAQTEHFWLSLPSEVPRGKRWQVQAVDLASSPYDIFGNRSAVDRIYPLASQPLIELCLRIPTYVLASDGVDRSLARDAFRSRLPATVSSRHTKGGIDYHVRGLLTRNLSFIREFLLDGYLVKNHILDGKRLETLLRHPEQMTAPEVTELMADHISTESWAVAWSDSVSRGRVADGRNREFRFAQSP